VNEFRILKALQTTDDKRLPLGEDPRRHFNVAVALLLIKGIEARLRDMPAFTEAAGVGIITALNDEEVG
jgi:hypothetical protein